MYICIDVNVCNYARMNAIIIIFDYWSMYGRQRATVYKEIRRAASL